MLFNKKITPNCAYCRYGDRIKLSDEVACLKKGVVSCEDSCRKFIYDPIKRVPDVPATFKPGDYSEEDFVL